MELELQKTKDFTEEYCCSVVRVGKLEPVENSDNLMRTVVNGERIVVNRQDVKEGDVKPYVPKRNLSHQQHGMKGVSRWDRIDRMVPGQFKLHYDTAPLRKHLMDFRPSTRITATVKMHGTSFICGNVLVNTPLRMFRVRRFINRLLRRSVFREVRQEYGMVVSSRKVIKNEWADTEHPKGFCGVDIWTEYARILYPYIPKGYTIYGEICGYLTDDARMIQKGYDYGCRRGVNFLMPYRVTRREEGRTVELSIEEVGRLTRQIKSAMCNAGETHNASRLFDIRNVRLFDGTVRDLIGKGGDIATLPDRLADLCQIERRETYCISHIVPREGVVVRMNGDKVAEAFKLKSLAFLEREKKSIDLGEVDMEMQEVAEGI